jgi:hypothetical protein
MMGKGMGTTGSFRLIPLTVSFVETQHAHGFGGGFSFSTWLHLANHWTKY